MNLSSRSRCFTFEALEPRLALAARPVIHEFVADNTDGLADEDGEHSDWIEIYNAGDASLDLAGWRLTDDVADRDKWTFPSRILPAGGYLIVFASGKDRLGTGPAGELHANFRLDADGEYLALVEPDGATIATEFNPFPPQRPNVGYGTGETVSPPLVAAGSAVRVHVPASATLGTSWTGAAANEPFDDSSAAGWTAGTAGVGYEMGGGTTETVGAALVARPLLDASAGDLYVLTTSSFAAAGALGQWSIYSTTTRSLTPVVVEDIGGGYTIRSIGRTRVSSGVGAQTFDFDVQAGSGHVAPGYYFGWFDTAASGPVVGDASFEQIPVGFFTSGMPAGTPWVGGAGSSVGIQNLNNSGFNGLFTTTTRADQDNVAYANGGTFSQTLANTLQAGIYTLTLNIGSRTDSPWPARTAQPIVQLLAGGTALSGTLTGTSPAAGTFSTYTLTVSVAAGSPHIGQAIAVRLGTTGTSFTNGQPNFDDVALAFSGTGGAGAVVPYTDATTDSVRRFAAAGSWTTGQALAAGTPLARTYSIQATSIITAPLQPLGYWNFDDASNPALALDASGLGRHSTVVGAAYTPDGGGRTALPGDRAMDFGPTGNGAHVNVTAAGAGMFDSATAHDALTIAMWVYGGPDQPNSGSVFYAAGNPDGSGTRVANAHLPWSDSIIYWDTGNGGDCCSSAARVSKPELDSSKWEGAWNHYAFVKNGDTKEIWQNGQLFLQGTNVYNLETIRGFVIGAGANNGSWSYGGKLDDVAVWDTALGSTEIAALALGASPLALSSYAPLIQTDLGGAMAGVNASAYLRMPLAADAAVGADALVLRTKYDDGFVAFLNGVEIARRNAPPVLAYDSSATDDRAKAAALRFEEITLPGGGALLRAGVNVLAFQLLNDSPTSGDALLVAELVGVTSAGTRYLISPTPGTANTSGVIDFVADTTFSGDPLAFHERGYYDAPFAATIATTTTDAEIRYTTDGSAPTATHGAVYSSPLAITGTTTLRAAAFKPGYQPTNVDTQTYLFAAQVAQQPVLPSGLPATWAGYPADYQVDPDVVGSTLAGYGFVDALLSIPTLSLVTDPDALFSASIGIYTNSGGRGDTWERPVSAEWVFPDGRPSAQIDAGLRIHGNISRQNDFTPKHSLRLHFRSEYGAGRFQYPLFPGSPVDSFDTLVLRGLSTDSWPVVEWGPNGEGFVRWTRQEASYLRDEWMRQAQLAMGRASANGTFVHLFLNGLYWGLYNLTERPDDAFAASYFGGDKDEYDVLKDFAELHAGSMDAWNQAMALASAGLSTTAAYQQLQGNNPDGTRNPAYPVLVDVDNLIDYMILHIASGGDDWPDHNWWAARRRGPDSEGFRFFSWDQEITNNSLVRTRNSWATVRYADVNTYNTPAYLYDRLRQNADFRRRFGDRVHLHFYNGGALTTPASDARWQSLAAGIDRAIVGESARWGDNKRAAPYKREVEWLANENWMHTSYWPQIWAIDIQRFRTANLYPGIETPVFFIGGVYQHGGHVAPGAQLGMTSATAGTIYYTTDGSDPSAPGAPTFIAPVTLPVTTRVKARTFAAGQWSALIEALFTVPLALRVDELMYHPSGSPDAEFIELLNIGETPVSLAGVRFAEGIDFTFAGGTLAPGQRAVVVRDAVAFAAAYGSAVPVAGVYTGALDNGGETLTLVDSLGGVIQSFAYDDEPPWHGAADGGGHSLVIRDPHADLATWNDAAAWRASYDPGGSPTVIDRLGGDFNADDRVDLADLALLQSRLDTLSGANRLSGDLSGDGAVTRADAARFAANYGRSVASPAASPPATSRAEPQSAARLSATRRRAATAESTNVAIDAALADPPARRRARGR